MTNLSTDLYLNLLRFFTNSFRGFWPKIFRIWNLSLLFKSWIRTARGRDIQTQLTMLMVLPRLSGPFPPESRWKTLVFIFTCALLKDFMRDATRGAAIVPPDTIIIPISRRLWSAIIQKLEAYGCLRLEGGKSVSHHVWKDSIMYVKLTARCGCLCITCILRTEQNS